MTLSLFYREYVKPCQNRDDVFLVLQKPSTFTLEKKTHRLWRLLATVRGNSYDAKVFSETFIKAATDSVQKSRDKRKLAEIAESAYFIHETLEHISAKNTTKKALLRPAKDKLEALYKEVTAKVSSSLKKPPLTIALDMKLYSYALELLTIDAISSIKKVESLNQLFSLCFQKRKLDLALCLLLQGASTAKPEEVSELIAYALMEEKYSEAKKLILKPFEKEYKRHFDGASLLHLAAMKGNKELVEILLQKGVHLETRDFQNKTVLHVACDYFHFDTALFLVHNKASITSLDSGNKAPFSIKDDSEKARAFYCSLFKSVPHIRAEIEKKGAKTFLKELKKNPLAFKKTCLLETLVKVGYLFSDAEVLLALAKVYPKDAYNDACQKIEACYPTSNPALLQFSHLDVNCNHLKEKAYEKIPEPSPEIALETLLSYTDDSDTKNSLTQFIDEITTRSDKKGGVPKNKDEREFFFREIEWAIKHLIQKLPTLSQPEKICKKLAKASKLCGGRYFYTPLRLYRTYCEEKPETVKEHLLDLLAELREQIVRELVDPLRVHTVNEFNEIARIMGHELGLKVSQSQTGFYDRYGGSVNKESVKERFFSRYTPQAITNIVYDALSSNTNGFRDLFIDWQKTRLSVEELYLLYDEAGNFRTSAIIKFLSDPEIGVVDNYCQ